MLGNQVIMMFGKNYELEAMTCFFSDSIKNQILKSLDKAKIEMTDEDGDIDMESAVDKVIATYPEIVFRIVVLKN